MGYTTKFMGSINVKGEDTNLDQFDSLMKRVYKARHGGNIHVYTGCPNLYLQWCFDRETCKIMWDGREKFYEYVEWMELICKWACDLDLSLEGKILWRGEHISDMGVIIVEQNSVRLEKFSE